jgi:hypothetical protein
MPIAPSGVRLDRHEPVPLYHRAARALEETIEDDETGLDGPGEYP